jgi:hypothetical protein
VPEVGWRSWPCQSNWRVSALDLQLIIRTLRESGGLLSGGAQTASAAPGIPSSGRSSQPIRVHTREGAQAPPSGFSNVSIRPAWFPTRRGQGSRMPLPIVRKRRGLPQVRERRGLPRPSGRPARGRDCCTSSLPRRVRHRVGVTRVGRDLQPVAIGRARLVRPNGDRRRPARRRASSRRARAPARRSDDPHPLDVRHAAASAARSWGCAQ